MDGLGSLGLLIVLTVCVATLLFVRFNVLLSTIIPASYSVYNIYWPPQHRVTPTFTTLLIGDTIDVRPRFRPAQTDNDAVDIQVVPSVVSLSRAPREEVKEVILGLEDFAPDDYLAQDESYFVPREALVNTYVPGVLIQANETCEPDAPPFLLVIVPSVCNHTIRRKAIRRTWASLAYGGLWPGRTTHHRVKAVFFFGTGKWSQALEDESAIHGDIVQADFLDTYRNLTLKMAAALHWSATYCRGARHVIKVDEDTVVNLPLLLDLLEIVSSHQGRYIMGFRHYHHQPPVIRRGRWKIDADFYPLDYFPRYVYGHSYVISGDSVQDLFNAYQHMPAVPAEDALFTGVLAKSLGVSRIHCAHFAHQLTPGQTFDGCSLAREEFVSHTGFRTSAGIYSLWGNLTSLKC